MEFDSEEDAASALENMDGSELFGRVVRCSHAKATTKLTPGKAVWNDEEWIKSHLDEGMEGAGEEVGNTSSDLMLVPSREVDEEDQ